MPLLNKYSKLVFLGDSNADNGNVLRMTSATYPRPDIYHHGRYSNGKIWADHLEQLSGACSINLAYGCATISNDIVAGTVPLPSGQRVQVPSLIDQVEQLCQLVGKLDPAELVFIQVGSNDLNSLVDKGKTYQRYRPFTTQQLADVLREAIEKLHDQCGARNVVVLNVRPREDYPYVIGLNDPEARRMTREWTVSLNSAIGDGVSSLQSKYGSDCLLAVFDTYAFQKQITGDPAAFGIDKDTAVPCYSGPTALGAQGLRSDIQLDSPDTKLFFDTAHLAKKAQALLAAEVVKQLAQWALDR